MYKTIYISEKEKNTNFFLANLPPILTQEEYVAQFDDYPRPTQKERKLSSVERVQKLSLIDQFRHSRDFGYIVDLNINQALRKGYELCVRNPHYNSDSELSRENYFNKKTGDYTAFTLVGESGTGKTTAVDMALKRYPKVISYVLKNSKVIQIPYLKVECPSGGSVRAFFDSCIREMEEALNIDIEDKRRYKTQHAKMDYFISLARRWNLGVLIIDELQNLFVARNYKLVEDFLTLVNDLKVPIIYIGTEKVEEFFYNKEFFTLRRLGEEISAKPFKKDFSWEFFMKELWEMQWMREYVPLNSEFIDVFYEETAGVIDRAVKLFKSAQTRAILDGVDSKEEFVPEYVRSISKNLYRSSRDKLKELSSMHQSGQLPYRNELSTQLAVIPEIITPPDLQEELNNKVSRKEELRLLKSNVLKNIEFHSMILPFEITKKDVNEAFAEVTKGKRKLDEELITKAVIKVLTLKNMKQYEKNETKEIEISKEAVPRFKKEC